MDLSSKQQCEYLRNQAKNIFAPVRGTWIDLLKWGAPHRANWITDGVQGQRNNNHIVDPTHLLALRSSVAGFLEGNTSTTRPWFRIATRDQERNNDYVAKAWLQHFSERCLSYFASSNFYHQAGNFYYDYHTVNTGAQYIEELPQGGLHYHTLIPGAYYVINDAYGEANILVREFNLNVKSIVDKYGRRNSDGKVDWSNISDGVRNMYEQGNYTEQFAIAHIVQPNPDYNFLDPDNPVNKEWLELTYELGTSANNSTDGQIYANEFSPVDNKRYLKRHTTRRKPFVVGKSSEDFEYGEVGPMLQSLGLIKSLNKKAISQDQAIEQILHPTLQGPATLRKSYISNAPNTFVPLDSRSASARQKLEPVFSVNPAIGALVQNVDDMRQMVDKLFYADFLLYLSRNPKTRTAAETKAILDEQQRIIGPNLQSLNFTFNQPHVEFMMDYVLYEDPFLDPIPEVLRGQSLKPEFVSVFAQAQKAADLPAVDRYMAMVANVAQIDPRILDKVNVDKIADIYEDRTYLPSGVNNPQEQVDAKREQAMRQAQRQQALQETIPAVAKAAKDASAVRQPEQ